MSGLQLASPMHLSSLLPQIENEARPRSSVRLSTRRVLPDSDVLHKLEQALDLRLHDLARLSGGLTGLLYLPPHKLTDLETFDGKGYMALHLACKTGDPDMRLVRALVDAGADLQAEALLPATPLDLAMLSGDSKLALYLVRKGINKDEWQPNPQPLAADAQLQIEGDAPADAPLASDEGPSKAVGNVPPSNGPDVPTNAGVKKSDPVIQLLESILREDGELTGVEWFRSRPKSGVYESLQPPTPESIDTTMWGAKGKYSAAKVDRMRQPVRRDQPEAPPVTAQSSPRKSESHAAHMVRQRAVTCMRLHCF
jgi:hypothetical protein